jgi:hypothetical protein
LALWRSQGWPVAVIGRVLLAAEGIVSTRDGQPVAFPHFAVDEITKLWA